MSGWLFLYPSPAEVDNKTIRYTIKRNRKQQPNQRKRSGCMIFTLLNQPHGAQMKTHASTNQTSQVFQEAGDGLVASLYEKLDAIERRLSTSQAPATWSVEDIGEWLGLSKYTTHQRVVTRPGFPEPIVPAGVHGGQKRWFADEVIEWFRQNRGSLPKARQARAGGRPRGRPRATGDGVA